MKSNKTCYQFEIHEEKQKIEQKIQDFLQMNWFEMNRTIAGTYYETTRNDFYNLLFEYSFRKDILNIYVYFGRYSSPVSLFDADNYCLGDPSPFQNMLIPFFKELAELSVRTNFSYYEHEGEMSWLEPRYNLTDKQPKPPCALQLKLMAFSRLLLAKYREILAITGFIISLIGLTLATKGMYFAMWIAGFEIITVIFGMKTKYKAVSVLTLVLCIAVMPFTVMQMIC